MFNYVYMYVPTSLGLKFGLNFQLRVLYVLTFSGLKFGLNVQLRVHERFFFCEILNNSK